MAIDSFCFSQLCKTLLFFFTYTHMWPLGILFDGSDSLFQTQQSFVSEVGNAVFLPHFTPTRLHHLSFVHRLLQTFFELDICCTITGTYPAYTAVVLTSYYRGSPCIGGLHYLRQYLQKGWYICNRTFSVPTDRMAGVWRFPWLFHLRNYVRECDGCFFNYHCKCFYISWCPCILWI